MNGDGPTCNTMNEGMLVRVVLVAPLIKDYCYSRTMRAARNIFLSICFIVPVPAAFGQDGAGQDIKAAGGSAKTAVVKTGAATGKISVKGVKATGRGIKWGARKIALGTGSGIEKSGAALKSVGR